MVRDLIDEANDVYVVTPTLPGRLAWLAWELPPSRHAADGDDSILTAFADAIEAFGPDHIVIALRSPEHANWQERGLIHRVRERFGLPLTSFELDPLGHVASTGASTDT